jgi:RimJ/RimL family protein N-acetyltransferase
MLLKGKTLYLLLFFLIYFLQYQSFGTEDEFSTKRNTRTSLSQKVKYEETEIQRPQKIPKKERSYAKEEDIELVRAKLTKRRTETPDNYYWKIFYQSHSAGKVSINLINEPLLGVHASIQIFLNQNFQGKGIGRLAYQKACELSHYNTVYATMRKNNVASFKAAQAAGFREVLDKTFKQCLMKWIRK